jgi:hypothetical protein
MTAMPTIGGEFLSIYFPDDVTLTGATFRTLFEAGETYFVTFGGQSVASGNGPTDESGVLELHWPTPVTGKILRISQSGQGPGSYWSVYDFQPICE